MNVVEYMGFLTLFIPSYRFDLIFLILDPQDEMFDRRLGGHLVSLYFKTHEDEEDENLVSIDTLNSTEVKHIQADTISLGNLPVCLGWTSPALDVHNSLDKVVSILIYFVL